MTAEAHVVQVDVDLLRTFRAYQRTGSYQNAADELDYTVPQVKRRLMELYEQLGVKRQAGHSSAIVASYLLREHPY